MMSDTRSDEQARGRIITFFSYKGGTGRSMALANIGWLLAGAGRRVLMIDWDLEAPGLHRYLHPFLSDPELVESPGLIDFLLEFADGAISTDQRDEEWFQPYTATLNYIRSIDFPFPRDGGRQGHLDLLPAGRQDEHYSLRVNGFNWERFYTAFGGGIFLEAVKQRLRKEYDYILIDSRTGISDTAGICTVQMPDDLVACFTLNRQSIAGCAAAARSAVSQRSQRGERAKLRVWPLPTRVEDAEKDKRDRIQTHAMRLFGDLMSQIPEESRARYWGAVAVRYQPFYAYEEILSVFGDRPHVTGSMLSSMEAMAQYLTHGEVSTFVPMPEMDRRRGLEKYQVGLSLEIPAAKTDDMAIAASELAIAQSLGRSGVERYLDDAPMEWTEIELRNTSDVTKGLHFVFFLSFAQADSSNDHLPKFLRDIRSELSVRVGDDSVLLWDDSLESEISDPSRRSESLRNANALLALVSPSFIRNEGCMSELRLFNSLERPIIPALWVPLASALPEELRKLELASEPEPYVKQGMRRLMQIRRYEPVYLEALSELVEQMVSLARSGRTTRSESDPVREKVRSLASTYSEIRKAMPPGPDRTNRMEGIAAEMRELPAEAWKYLPEFKDSIEPGERLAAIVMLQARPARTFVDWLATRVDPRIERPFIGYHAAVALRKAANELASDDLPVVKTSILKALKNVKDEPGSDRERTLNIALADLERRASTRDSFTRGSLVDYTKTCFVIMPFGKRRVGDRDVDFDDIYDRIFHPAISAVELPEGGTLEPHRTDPDFFTGDIKQDMFEYLEYSRFAVADISGLNFNVAYELGTRHRARESGTAIFRQTLAPLPFDISAIKAFPYEYEPEENAKQARWLITRVLTESLRGDRTDSPIRLALKAKGLEHTSGILDKLQQEAENAIRNLDWPRATDIYRGAIAIEPRNPVPRMKLGLLCKYRGMWPEALEQFTAATEAVKTYGEAWREKGIVENKIAQLDKRPLDANPAPGEPALRRAIELNDNDFDAYASLGGVLKRAKRYPEALQCYERSALVSGGHPYPLLNALNLRAQLNGRLELKPYEQRALSLAERVREAQTKQDPPYDAPWSFFDLAQIRLFRGDVPGFITAAKAGLAASEHNWQAKIFLDMLRLLLPASNEIPGLEQGIAELEMQLA
jgi:tetratricopeptide (TPR) repeat protein